MPATSSAARQRIRGEVAAIDPPVESQALACFHCGLPVPGGHWRAPVLGEPRDFCCGGCLAAAQAISGAGLEAYYRMRSEPASCPTEPDAADEILFDREDLQRSFVRIAGDRREASLVIEGVRCPACLWLNEQRLKAMPGVLEAHVVYASRSARVAWDASRVKLSTILAAVRQIGYRARPFDPSHRLELDAQAARRDTGRLLFAGLVGMMVMNLALASYFLGGPDGAGRLALWEVFGRWCSLAAAAALLAYPGQEFLVGAWRDLRHLRAGMDVPIALGLLAAWIGSAWATLRGSGPVYFDAIAMLVFSVLLARAFETRARRRAASDLDRFAVIEPATARRIGPDGRESEILALDLATGDRIRVRPGEIVGADGIIEEGRSTVDEAVLTGEPWPRPRGPGEAVVAGSCNVDQPLLLRVTRAGEASTLGEIRRLLDKGLASRPGFAQLADRLSGWLVTAVLLVSAATAAWWARHDPSSALPATVAVLIVTCPCALALATPIGLTLSAARLARLGVLPARMAAIDRLARADTAVFDKTGTLTRPIPRLEEVQATGLEPERACRIAASLEAESVHPIARAIVAAGGEPTRAMDLVHHPGQGVTGTVDGARWWLGSPEFAPGDGPIPEPLATVLECARREGMLAAILSDRRDRAAVFTFSEQLRPGADRLVEELERSGIRHCAVLSGDRAEPVTRLGEKLGFDDARGQMTAAGKLEWIRSRRERGADVLFVGDGLNDAPTLAAADVSASFAEAPQLSRLTSDFVVLGNDLQAIPAMRRVARRSHHLLVQNVVWALAYNVVAMPLAAAGAIVPWMAALGMSASSLAVVGNAMRLARPSAGEGRDAPVGFSGDAAPVERAPR